MNSIQTSNSSPNGLVYRVSKNYIQPRLLVIVSEGPQKDTCLGNFVLSAEQLRKIFSQNGRIILSAVNWSQSEYIYDGSVQ